MGSEIKTAPEVQVALQALVGLRWWTIGRAADLLWMHFGEVHEVPAWGGGTKKVGQWALHVQCPWQICVENKVVLSASDYYVDSQGNPVADEPDRLAQSRFDDVAKRICHDFEVDAPTVVSVSSKEDLGFVLSFSDGSRFEVMPDASDEVWRLFEPSTDKPHFVAHL